MLIKSHCFVGSITIIPQHICQINDETISREWPHCLTCLAILPSEAESCRPTSDSRRVSVVMVTSLYPKRRRGKQKRWEMFTFFFFQPDKKGCRWKENGLLGLGPSARQLLMTKKRMGLTQWPRDTLAEHFQNRTCNLYTLVKKTARRHRFAIWYLSQLSTEMLSPKREMAHASFSCFLGGI